MPEIALNIPSNSRFHSSMNEIDLVMQQILLREMRIADPRTKNRNQDITTDVDSEYLWDNSRVFQVDELTTEEIFNTYLLRKNINNSKNVDVSYPILGFIQDDIDTVFWGTGNRYKQNYFNIPVDSDSWEVGDEVNIVVRGDYFGLTATIAEVKTEDGELKIALEVNGTLLQQRNKAKGNKWETIWFTTDQLRQTGDKLPQQFKAKAITGTYTATLLCDTRDEAQYIRDHYIMRVSDAEIWFTFNSPTINNSQNQIFTVFGIPNLERYPNSNDKLKGQGYVYGVAFTINYWTCLTDTPLPAGYIEAIRMNLHVDTVDRVNRIVVSGE